MQRAWKWYNAIITQRYIGCVLEEAIKWNCFAANSSHSACAIFRTNNTTCGTLHAYGRLRRWVTRPVQCLPISPDWSDGKGKVYPGTGHEGPEGEHRYGSTLSLTLALDVGGWSTSGPGRFIPENGIRYQFYRKCGQGLRAWSPPPGLHPQTV